jgi:hypothetical protein
VELPDKNHKNKDSEYCKWQKYNRYVEFSASKNSAE